MSIDKGKINLDYKGNLTGAKFAFAGMNFMVDPADLPIEEGQCVDICNCDIDYHNNVSRRNGFTKVFTGNVANAWSNEDYTYCTVDGLLCYVLLDNGTPQVLPIADAPELHGIVVYKQVNNIVAFSDGTNIGILDGTSVTLFNNSIFDI